MGISHHKTARLIAERYHVMAKLGEGGMGSVYQVEDRSVGRILALKRLHRVTDEQRMARRAAWFEREYYLLTELVHPRVIEVYDYGVDEEGPYYTMELVDGIDAKDLPGLDWRDTCSLLRDIASSLALLHSRRLVHRDISTGNVRRTIDGQAKLLDFGCMAPMGVRQEVVGTLPFLPPEALHGQPLDARTDLYSLGAVAYWLLTGRDAYACSQASELRDAWRSRPPTVHALVDNVPVELSELVMSLLSLTREARPGSAAQIMERLTTLADLEADESLEVSQAYLTTPTLVGRETEIMGMRKRLIRARRGRGSAIMVEGEPGMGRSRLLDAWVLEGKLIGLPVARLAGRETDNCDYGAIRKIVADLLDHVSPEAQHEAQALAERCVGVVPELGSEHEATVPEKLPRSELQTALVEWLVSVASERALVIVVDDLHRIDEPSAATLAALSQQPAVQPIVLAVSIAGEVPGQVEGPVSLIREASSVVSLSALDAAQSRELLDALFGDVPHVARVAAAIHQLGRGRPRDIMELAQHLVDSGVIRYGGGTWLLPERLDEGALPESFQAMLAAQTARLSVDARALGQAVALETGAYTVDELQILSGHGSLAVLYRALDELLAADVFVWSTDGYTFAHGGWVQAFLAGLEDARACELHLRLSEVFAGRKFARTYEARHLRLAGRAHDALDVIYRGFVSGRAAGAGAPQTRHLRQLWSGDTVGELQAAVDASARMGLSTREHYGLLRALINMAFAYQPEVFARYLPRLLVRLTRDSGLDDWHELGHIRDANDRARSAMGAAEARFEAARQEDRVWTPSGALGTLLDMCGHACNAAANLQDHALVEGLPDVEPFAPLSPRVATYAALFSGANHSIGGRTELAMETYGEALRLFDKHLPQRRSGLVALGVEYSLAVARASLGMKRALDRIEALERTRVYQVSVWRLRSLFHLRQGDTEKAAELRKRADLLQLQNKPTQFMQGTLDAAELPAYHAVQDILGLKRAIDRIAKRAERHATWAVWWHYGQGAYKQLLGDPERSVAEYREALDNCKPGRHIAWSYAAAGHIEALIEAGRPLEAVDVGRRQMDEAQRAGLRAKTCDILLSLSLAEAEAGDQAAAISHCEQVIAKWQQLGATGLNLGRAYEARARLAIRDRDRDRFTHYATLCAEEFRRGGNLALNARLDTLLDQARQSFGETQGPAEALATGATIEAGANMAHVEAELAACTDASERAARALEILLDVSGAKHGHLFGLRDEEHLELMCSSEGARAPEGLAAMLGLFLEAETKTADVTVFEEAAVIACTAVDGREFRPLVLHGSRAGQPVVAGAVALEHASRDPLPVPLELLRTIGDHLVAAGDVATTEAAR